MKEFIKDFYNLIFSTFLIVFIFFVLKTFLVYNSGFYIKNNKIYKYNDFNIGIFGHSQSLGALDEKLLSDNEYKLRFENFSITGAPLFYTSDLINYTLSKNPRADIILEIGTNNVDERGTIRGFHDKNSYFHLNNFFYYSLFNDLFFFIQNKKEDVILFLFKSFFNNPLYNFTGFQGWNSNLEEAKKNFLRDSITINKDVKKFSVDLEINKIDKLIKRNPENQFYIIRLPEHNLYLKIFSNSERYKSVINRLKKNKNVFFYDFVDFELPENGYRDLYHLSKKGGITFTEYFKTFFLKNYETK